MFNIQDKHEILIIDDYRDHLQLLSGLLHEQGYRVRGASDSEMALKSIKAQLPDLVLVDIKMPGMDGIELCHRLKRQASTESIPVIFISVLSGFKDKARAFRAGGADFITKPFPKEELLAKVSTQLRLLDFIRVEQQQHH